MKTVGVRELKAHLSSVLRDVARGDVYLVTDRGRVVAELRSPGAATMEATREQLALARLAATGQLRVAERAASAYAKSPLTSRHGAARKLIDLDRGE